ncbi:hypothetical protein IV102_38330 [bacterium]|nr:hypothetical protein [bacterium]
MAGPLSLQAASEVTTFHADTLKRRYYEDFCVNSKNWMEMSAGTQKWIEKFGKVMSACAKAVSQEGPSQEVRLAMDSLFELLEQIDDGDQYFVFFADEAGSWQVGVDWSTALPAWFTCLASSAGPQGYAADVLCKIDSFAPGQRKKLLAQARKVASPAQRQVLAS